MLYRYRFNGLHSISVFTYIFQISIDISINLCYNNSGKEDDLWTT